MEVFSERIASLFSALEERIERSAQETVKLRDAVAALETDRARLQQEQESLLERISELESEIARIRHLEIENSEIVKRHETLTDHVEKLLSHLNG